MALGKNQIEVLKLLAERQGWYVRCGWVWGGDHGTKRVLASLVKRGLAQHIGAGGAFSFDRWLITDAGHEALEALD